MRSFLSAIGLILFSTCVLQAQEDSALTAVTAKFAKQRYESRMRALASLADELGALQQKLTASGDTLGAAKAATELESIMAELQPMLESPAEQPAAQPAPPLTGGKEEENLDAIFSGTEKPAPLPPQESPDSEKGAAHEVTLKSNHAKLSNGGELTRSYFNVPGATATWTLQDLPPGNYKISANYSTPDGSGGSAKICVGEDKKGLIFSVPTAEGKVTKVIAALSIETCPLDISIEAVTVKPGAPGVFELSSLTVSPHAPDPSKPAPVPGESPSPGKGGLFEF